MRVNYINTALNGKASSKTRKLSVENLPPVRSFSNKDSCGSDNSLLPAAPLHFTAQIINLQKYAREQGVLHEMAVVSEAVYRAFRPDKLNHALRQML